MNVASDVADIGHDPDALDAFYRAHIELVERFIARRVTSPQDAADLTADVFIEAIESCHRYRTDSGTPSAWLYGVARHVVARHHRSAGRAARATARFRSQLWLDDDATECLAARIDAERDARALFESLASLSERQRAVVELVAVDGLGLNEAADVLGITPTNARVRYHRARQRLSHALPTTFEVTT
jgi:RNA polymerase sigma factor (sigma-70 family)